jgi:hypothetical protein
METTECLARRTAAADQFCEHEDRKDGTDVTHSLSYGLTTLRSLFFKRIHDDVERKFGVDSMMIPVSLIKGETKAKAEIEIFQIAEVTAFVQVENLVTDADWFQTWLGHLRIGDGYQNEYVQHRLTKYRQLSNDKRRLKFSTVLERSYHEASRAPLVLYRLFPLAVGIVTAMAFDRHLKATELRSQQTNWLPAIMDCHECHGRVHENGERCQLCGNPVWTYKWLTTAD